MSRSDGAGREDVGPAREVLLDDVVLRGAGEGAHRRGRVLPRRDRLLLGRHLVEREQPHRGGVDGHRGVHLRQRDLVEQRPQVADVRDRHPDLADLTAGEGVVGVVAGLGGEVERDREPGLSLGEVAPVELVAGGGTGVAGIRAHHPRAVPLPAGRPDGRGGGILGVGHGAEGTRGPRRSGRGSGGDRRHSGRARRRRAGRGSGPAVTHATAARCAPTCRRRRDGGRPGGPGCRPRRGRRGPVASPISAAPSRMRTSPVPVSMISWSRRRTSGTVWTSMRPLMATSWPVACARTSTGRTPMLLTVM